MKAANIASIRRMWQVRKVEAAASVWNRRIALGNQQKRPSQKTLSGRDLLSLPPPEVDRGPAGRSGPSRLPVACFPVQ